MNQGREFSKNVFESAIVVFVLYGIFSVVVFFHCNGLIKAMSLSKDIDIETVEHYLQLETLSFMAAIIVSFANVVFVVIGKSKNVYIFMAAKVVLSVASDLFFIPHFGIYGVALSGLLVNFILSILCLSLLRKQNAFTVCALGKSDIAALKDWARIGFFSGTQQFLDNIIYTIMICKMVNMVAFQGDYWNANNFIWGYLLIPAAALSEVVKKDCKNGYSALKQKNYYFIVLAICLFWLVTIPLWRPFYSKVERLANARVIFDITIKLMPFYVSYAICCIIDSIFVGLGKTKYNFITSLIVNLVYYGVFFLLYRANVITMSMDMIIIMFGFGMIFHLVVALIEEKIFLRRELPCSV